MTTKGCAGWPTNRKETLRARPPHPLGRGQPTIYEAARAQGFEYLCLRLSPSVRRHLLVPLHLFTAPHEAVRHALRLPSQQAAREYLNRWQETQPCVA